MVPSLLAQQPRRSARRPHTPISLSPTTPLHFAPKHLPSPLQSPTTNLFPPRVKQEPHDTTNYIPPMDDATQPATNGRTKRKPKDKVELVVPTKVLYEPPTHEIPPPDHPDDNNDDDGGITRCVCGRTELDADEDENGVMVMCETCKVWQHGVCVNLNEDATEQDYYCEQCRPDLHVDLLKSLKKRSRHNNSQHHRRPSASVPRSSRSHSPGHILASVKSTQPKRRNTMNSRDADYEESLKQLIESTRPDAERHPDHDKDDLTHYDEPGVIIEIVSGARKKRKRQADKENDKRAAEMDKTENFGPPHKRQRSNSATPDQNLSTTHNTTNGTTTNGTTASRHASTSSGAGPKPIVGASKKRGRKEPVLSGDGPDGSFKKHPNQYTYRKGATATAAATPPKRPGLNGTHSLASHPGSSSNAHDHGTRRNAHAPHAPPAPQPLLTSWGLPDYLAHLASELPTDVPQPVQIRIIDLTPQDSNAESVAHATTGAVEDTVLERGVKVKWPAKRTSVADMNKRVRGIIDWVGREQAMALDRRRRTEALRSKLLVIKPPETEGAGGEGEGERAGDEEKDETSTNTNVNDIPLPQPLRDSEATHLMEELMKELIAFQEKFGPGAKGKERRAAG